MINAELFRERVKPILDMLKIAAMIAVVHLILRLAQMTGSITYEVRQQTEILNKILIAATNPKKGGH